MEAKQRWIVENLLTHLSHVSIVKLEVINHLIFNPQPCASGTIIGGWRVSFLYMQYIKTWYSIL